MPPKKRKKRKRKGRYIRGTYVSPIAGECRFRSSWELKVMEKLDSNPDVLSWSYEKTIIEYVSNIRTGKIRKYYPDFLVKYKDGTSELLEVKPKRKLEQLTVRKKIAAAQEWCTKHDVVYKILTEIELKDLGLL